LPVTDPHACTHARRGHGQARADVICLQEVSPYWAAESKEMLGDGWLLTAQDKKAILHRAASVTKLGEMLEPVFPEPDAGEGRKHRHVLWAAPVGGRGRGSFESGSPGPFGVGGGCAHAGHSSRRSRRIAEG